MKISNIEQNFFLHSSECDNYMSYLTGYDPKHTTVRTSSIE